MVTSLHIKFLKIDKFVDFSRDIDYISRTDVFRDVLSFIINQCDPRRPQGASGGHIIRQPRNASKRSALIIVKCRHFILFETKLHTTLVKENFWQE